MKALAPIFALIALIVSTPTLATPPALTDQHGKSGGMNDFSGKPVIVFVTSLTKLPQLGAWEEALRPEVPFMNSLDIGDIGKASAAVRKEVIKELDKHVPEGVSVYIDEQNLWADEYNLDLKEPAVLIFDADHKLVETFSGKPKGDLLDQVITAAKQQFPGTGK